MIVIHRHGPRPTSAATGLFVLTIRVPYTIFAAATELFIVNRRRLPCILGSGGGDVGERQWAISHHPL